MRPSATVLEANPFVSSDSLTKSDPRKARGFRDALGLGPDRILLVASAGTHEEMTACCLLDRRPAQNDGRRDRWAPTSLLDQSNREVADVRFMAAAVASGVMSGHSALTFRNDAGGRRLERDPRLLVATLVYQNSTARLLLKRRTAFPTGWSRAAISAMRRATLVEARLWPLGLPEDASGHETIRHPRRVAADLALHEALLDVLLPGETA